jgi:carboxymethylenebutenolidase
MLHGAADRLDKALTTAGVAHDVKEYPEVGHAFLNDHAGTGEKVPLLYSVMARLTPGFGYNEAAARDARARITAFFGEHLAE